MMSFVSDPVALLLLIILVGKVISRLRVREVSLGLSAVLILSVLAGYCISALAPSIVDEGFSSGMDLLSRLGTALFVSAVGIVAGTSMADGVGARDALSFCAGAIMVGVGALTMWGIGCIDAGIDGSLLSGLLCGAMTSTPGLSSLCDVGGAAPELAVLGYSVSYLFGVLGTVLFVQLGTGQAAHASTGENTGKCPAAPTAGRDPLLPIAISVLSGIAFNSIEAACFNFSLGFSGATLCAAVAVGFLLKKWGGGVDGMALSVYRGLGLLLFFVGMGVPAGVTLTTPLSPLWFAYGAVITSVPILSGYMIGRYLLRRKRSGAMCIVAGGMTSTPAIGALLRGNEDRVDLRAYSFSYVGSLLAMIFCMRV